MTVAPIERNNEAPPNEDAFLFGFEISDSGCTPVNWAEAERRPAAGSASASWRWLHFNRLAAETQLWLETVSGLDETAVAALLQDETRPRCSTIDGGVFLNLRGVNHNPGAEPEDMISVRIWANESVVLSMRSYPVRAISAIRESAAAGELPRSPGALLVAIASGLLDKIEPLVDQLREEVDEFEEELLDRSRALEPKTLSEFRRTVLILRRYIQPQRDAMAQLQRVGRRLLSDDDEMRLQESGDRVTRLSEELDSIRERAAVLQDQGEAARQSQLNARLLVMAIISALFLPLTFLTGLLGMNVAGIPAATNPMAFAVVCLIMACVAGGTLAVMKIMRLF
ncbi:zinc transporter ZntB [bacterium]|nr:zinc transporter ZntB [bacterium]